MNKSVPFEEVSEAPGIPIADEAASMIVTRYRLAAEVAVGRRTLELACASGPGLRWIASKAKLTVGADIDPVLLNRAARHYAGTIPLARLSATQLPFPDNSFDLVLFLEASYYVADFSAALREIARILSPGGMVCFANANPERPDFIRSPYSHRYHTADDFRAELGAAGFTVRALAAFPVDATESDSTLARIPTSLVKLARLALERMHLVPSTLKGRAQLKRLLGQRLRPLPAEFDENFAQAQSLCEIGPGPQNRHKVIYVLGTLTT